MTEEAVTALEVEKKKAKKDTPPTGEVRGMTFYSDGGVRPINPGFAACGLHGYTWNTGITLKGVGLGSVVTSSSGYLPKSEIASPEGKPSEWILDKLNSGRAVQVMPEEFVDAIVVVGLQETNQVAEMMGAVRAMEYFEEEAKKAPPGKELKFLQILSDSEYTCKGANEYMERWCAGGWRRRDGAIISNVELWKRLRDVFNRIRDSGVNISLKWVRAHDGETGNERVDKLATLGVFHAWKHRDPTFQDVRQSPVEGYWKMEFEHHPFLSHKCVYFNTLPGSCEKGVYYLGNHGKDEDLLGSRMSDGSFAVVKLIEGDDAIEQIRQIQAEVGKFTDSLYSANLSNLFTPDVSYYWNKYGTLGVRPTSEYRNDLDFLGKIPLTREYKPAKISMRSVEALEILDQYLSDFTEGKTNVKTTDITDKLYETTTKTVKGVEEKIVKLRPEIVVGLPSIDVEITNPVSESGKAYKLTLTLGMDLLARNSLKRLEALNPQVYVLTWEESEKAFRYATVIKAQGCVGIWAGYYSNLRLLP